MMTVEDSGALERGDRMGPAYKRGKEWVDMVSPFLAAMYDPIRVVKLNEKEQVVLKYLWGKITRTEVKYMYRYYVKEMTYAEIAKELGCVISTVHRAVKRADKKLVDILYFVKELGVI